MRGPPPSIAVKIRCRNRRTSSSTCRQSIWRQSSERVLWSTHHDRGRRRLACPRVPGSSSSSSSQAHLTASARFRVRAPGPVSGQLSTAISWRTDQPSIGFLLPFGHRHSLLGHPIPAGELGPPHGRLTEHAQGVPDPDGVTAFRTHELRPGWVPSIPRGRRCSPRPRRLPGRRLPHHSGQSLHPAALPTDRGSLNEASTRVHAIRPSGLPLACGRPDGTGRPWAFPRASHPADQEPDDARQGGDRPSSTDLELHAQLTSVDLQSGSSLVACDLASHVAKAIARCELAGR